MSEKIFLCSICNINSGTCKEDCKFCSQSVRYKADIQRYKQKPLDAICQEAVQAQNNGALGFCLVTADKGLTDKTLEFVCNVAQEVQKVAPQLRLIACNGTASVEQLLALKEAGIKAYNHNLETSEAFYPQICTTHTWSERYETCQMSMKQVWCLSAVEFLDWVNRKKIESLCSNHSNRSIRLPYLLIFTIIMSHWNSSQIL